MQNKKLNYAFLVPSFIYFISITCLYTFMYYIDKNHIIGLTKNLSDVIILSLILLVISIILLVIELIYLFIYIYKNEDKKNMIKYYLILGLTSSISIPFYILKKVLKKSNIFISIYYSIIFIISLIIFVIVKSVIGG